MNKSILRSAILFLIITTITQSFSFAQLQRKRANPNAPVEEIFWAPTLIGTSTVSTLSQGDLNFTVQHNFGLVSGGIDNFFGLDDGATVRLAFAYGITDRFMVNIGRTNNEDIVDLGSTIRLVRQTKSNSTPIDIAIRGNVGIATEEIQAFDADFSDRLSYLASIMFARKFSDDLSLQVSPMFSHFNTVVISEADRSVENDHFGVGFVGNYRLNDIVSFSAEYLPVFGKRTDGTINHFGGSLEINTGGHVFQIFLTSGEFFTEQHLLARTNNDFLDGDFQIGFTINRVFSPGKRKRK